MKRYDANEEMFEKAALFGKPVLFSQFRIDGNTIPKCLNLYEIRHDDEVGVFPVQIAKGILVNFFGTIITNDELSFDSDRYIDITENDIDFGDGELCKIDDFIKEYVS